VYTQRGEHISFWIQFRLGFAWNEELKGQNKLIEKRHRRGAIKRIAIVKILKSCKKTSRKLFNFDKVREMEKDEKR
jgi:hypothetical protein